MKFAGLLFKLATLSFALAAATVEDIDNEKDFFVAGQESKHLVVGFYDSQSRPESKELIKKMLDTFSRDPEFANHNYRFAAIDFKSLDRIVKHYNVEGSAGLFYYIENQLQQFREFGQIVNSHLDGRLTREEVYGQARKFLVDKHVRISKRLKSVEDFNAALAANKIMGLYLGSESSSGHQNYRRLAYNHISFHFFEIADKALAQMVYRQVTKADWNGRDVFLIVRHKSVLTDFDPKEAVELDASKTYDYFRTFLVLERNEKLRNDNHGGDIFMDVFHRKVKLVLHTYNSQTPHSEIQAFEEAVQRMPKGMFYANVDTNAQWVGHFLQMFQMSKMKMEADKLYFMHAAGHEFHIQEFVSDMDEASIYDAIWGVYRKNKDLFNSEEKAIMEGDDSLSGVQDEL